MALISTTSPSHNCPPEINCQRRMSDIATACPLFSDTYGSVFVFLLVYDQCLK